MVGDLRRLALLGVLGLGLMAALPAKGAELSVKQMMEILARTDAANSRCHILSDADSRILAALLRQAELNLVATVDHANAAAIRSKAQQLGNSVRCDQTTRSAVNAVMSAAQQTVFGAVPEMRGADIELAPLEVSTASSGEEVAIGEDEAVTAMAPPVQEPTPSVAKPVNRSKADAPKPAVKRSVPQRKTRNESTVGQLAAYEAIAERYYRERRCRNMSKTAISVLYGKVVASHRQVVANFGARTVRLHLRRAETKANARGC